MKHYLKICLIALIGLLCSVFFCKPHNSTWQLVNDSASIIKFESLIVKKENLTDNLKRYSPDLHEAKGVFRLTAPVLMKIFHINTLPQLYILQILIGVLLYVLMSALAYQALGNYFSSAALIIAISATYYGRAFFLDTYPWLDTFGFFFAILAIWGRRYWWIVVPAIIALFYCDERGVLCTGIVYISILLIEAQDINALTISSLYKPTKALTYVWAAIAISIVIRLVLMFGYDLSMSVGSNAGIVAFLIQWKTFQLGLFDGLVGVWGLFFIAVFHAFANKRWLIAVLFLGPVLLYTLVSAGLHDITRTIVYTMPLVFVVAKYLNKNLQDMRYILLCILFTNIMFPHGFGIKDMIFNNTGYPILFDIFFKLKNILGL